MLSSKELPANAGDAGLIPGLGRFSGEGNGNPLQYSCLGNSMTEEPGQLQSIGSQRVRRDSTLHNRDNRYIVVSHFCLHLLNNIGYEAYSHMFICLYFSSLVMCLLRSLTHFLARLFVFLLLSYECSLYI